jgi:uncharacterized protein
VIPARLSVLTLGVRNMASMREFYAGLGWDPAIELDDFVAFRTSGAVLTLYPLEQLADDARVAPAVSDDGLRGFTLAINVERPEQVDETLDSARAAGARVTKEPVTADWGGRTAYFADPEDNYWEVAWVPPDSNMAELLKQAAYGADG